MNDEQIEIVDNLANLLLRYGRIRSGLDNTREILDSMRNEIREYEGRESEHRAELDKVRAEIVNVAREIADIDASARMLVDDGLPGRTIGIALHDGYWSVQQMYTGLEESYPTDLHGCAREEEGLAAAIEDAYRMAMEQKEKADD